MVTGNEKHIFKARGCSLISVQFHAVALWRWYMTCTPNRRTFISDCTAVKSRLIGAFSVTPSSKLALHAVYTIYGT